MIDNATICIVGDNSSDTLHSHQSRTVSCSLHFNGKAVHLNAHDSMKLNVDDCIAMRDFLSATINDIKKKEIE